MKTRFSSLDLVSQLPTLRSTLVGMRVNQVYDIDHKSYIIKLQVIKSVGAILEPGYT